MRRIKALLACLALLAGTCFGADQPVTAKSWLVADDSGSVLSGYNTTEIRSIASITKLFTVMAVLDAFQPLDASIRTKQFGVVSRRTLAEMALVRSDNTAASILCEEYPTGYSGCIAAMNAKAAELQMTSTSFSDATGLNKTNVSTADDLVKLVAAASTYPLIVAASDMNHVKMKTRNKWFVMNNTNPLVGQGHGIIVSKTGFINLSGGCIVMMMNTARGIRTVILLGSKNTKTRIPEAATLASLY